MNRILILAVAAALGLAGEALAQNPAPEPITDLTATATPDSQTFRWTAPRDRRADGTDGATDTYELRWSTQPIPNPLSDAQFNALREWEASPIPDPPRAPGLAEVMHVPAAPPPPEYTYYIVIRSADSAGLHSAASNTFAVSAALIPDDGDDDKDTGGACGITSPGQCSLLLFGALALALRFRN